MFIYFYKNVCKNTHLIEIFCLKYDFKVIFLMSMTFLYCTSSMQNTFEATF
jgi:hypothetical protein